MLQFHSSDYLQFLQSINDVDDEEKFTEEADQYGLSKCCVIKDLILYVGLQPFSFKIKW